MKGGLCKRFSLYLFIGVHTELVYIINWICNQAQPCTTKLV
jgi:hypothetical protein